MLLAQQARALLLGAGAHSRLSEEHAEELEHAPRGGAQAGVLAGAGAKLRLGQLLLRQTKSVASGVVESAKQL